jgi:hypothetical protein
MIWLEILQRLFIEALMDKLALLTGLVAIIFFIAAA